VCPVCLECPVFLAYLAAQVAQVALKSLTSAQLSLAPRSQGPGWAPWQQALQRLQRPTEQPPGLLQQLMLEPTGGPRWGRNTLQEAVQEQLHLSVPVELQLVLLLVPQQSKQEQVPKACS